MTGSLRPSFSDGEVLDHLEGLTAGMFDDVYPPAAARAKAAAEARAD